MVRLTGAAFSFLAFGITTFLGLAAGNSAETILIRALEAMFVFLVLGLTVGWIGCRVLDEHAVRRQRELFPDEHAPSESSSDAPVDSAAAAGLPA